MMKIIISLLLIVFATVLCAQEQDDNVTIEFSKLKLEKSKTVNLISAFKINEGYIVFKKEPIRGPGGWRYFLEKFDDNFKSLKTYDVSGQFEDEGYIIKKIIKIGDDYALFTTKNFKDKLKEELYVQTFNWKKGNLSSVRKLYGHTYEKRRKRIQFSVTTSNDESQLLLTIYPLKKKGEEKTANYTVFNHELEIEWTEEDVSFKKESRVYSISNTILSNNGLIYALGRHYIAKNKKAGIKRGKNKYEMVTISEGDKEITPIDTKDLWMSGVTLTESKDGTLYFGGYYRGENIRGIEGVFLYKLDENGEVLDQTWDEFTDDFIKEGLTKRETKKAKKKEAKDELGLTKLYLRRIIKHDDGSISMVGERFWITTTTTTDANGHTHTTTTYHYDDLIITRISKDGEVISNTRFAKHHFHYGAYEYFNLKNELIIVMNNSRNNLVDVNLEGMPRKEKRKYFQQVLTLHKINEEGEIERSLIMDYFSEKYMEYGTFSSIGGASVLIEDDGAVEIIALTRLGKKEFVIGKFSFEK